MSEIDFVVNENQIKLVGKLNFQSVPDIQKPLLKLLSQKQAWTIDLSAVSFSDSAGLALLVDCQRTAKKQSNSLKFLAMPKQMLAMAKVTGVEPMLELNNE